MVENVTLGAVTVETVSVDRETDVATRFCVVMELPRMVEKNIVDTVILDAVSDDNCSVESCPVLPDS